MSSDLPDVRSAIITSAADAFAEDGYAATTVDLLADRIGATKGLVYYHFRSKFDIYLAIYERGMSLLRAEVESRMGGGRKRPRASRSDVARPPGQSHDTSRVPPHDPPSVRGQMNSALKPRQQQVLVELNSLRLDYENLFVDVMTEGVADGSIRAGSPRMAAKVLLSSLNGIDLWYRRREGQTLAETESLADQIVELLIGGLRAAN